RSRFAATLLKHALYGVLLANSARLGSLSHYLRPAHLRADEVAEMRSGDAGLVQDLVHLRGGHIVRTREALVRASDHLIGNVDTETLRLGHANRLVNHLLGSHLLQISATVLQAKKSCATLDVVARNRLVVDDVADLARLRRCRRQWGSDTGGCKRQNQGGGAHDAAERSHPFSLLWCQTRRIFIPDGYVRQKRDVPYGSVLAYSRRCRKIAESTEGNLEAYRPSLVAGLLSVHMLCSGEGV